MTALLRWTVSVGVVEHYRIELWLCGGFELWVQQFSIEIMCLRLDVGLKQKAFGIET